MVRRINRTFEFFWSWLRLSNFDGCGITLQSCKGGMFEKDIDGQFVCLA